MKISQIKMTFMKTLRALKFQELFLQVNSESSVKIKTYKIIIFLVGLYEHATLSLTVREQHKMRVPAEYI
jgi:hypothetical protein